MTEVFAIAIGGALGALARYGLGGVITAMAGTAFPWATLVINVVGSFAIGVLALLGCCWIGRWLMCRDVRQLRRASHRELGS